jgi:hypothetical protein
VTGRIARTFPGAARLERRDDEWDVYRLGNKADVEDADAYLGTVYSDDGGWYAVHALHSFDPATGLDYTGVGDPGPICTTTDY